MPLALLIGSLSLEALKVFQAWCAQNPGATAEDMAAQIRTMNASDASATAEYDRNKAEFDRLRKAGAGAESDVSGG